MKPISSFRALADRLSSSAGRIRVAVASPADDHTAEVINRAIDSGMAAFTLVVPEGKGHTALGLHAAHPQHTEIIAASDDDDAARRAVAEVRQGRADVLMKGSLNTDNLLHAVLDKEHGLLPPGRVLTHIAAAEIAAAGRMLFFTDAAVIPNPTTEQLDAQCRYITDAWRNITGLSRPRVALTHCTEKTSPRFPVTLSYQTLRQRAAEGQYGPIDIDGPMDVKTACDAESGAIKGLSSPVVGQADIMLFPDIEAGNTFYKTITCFAHATVAGMLAGTTAPVVVTSRADTADSKFYSLALACALTNQKQK